MSLLHKQLNSTHGCGLVWLGLGKDCDHGTNKATLNKTGNEEKRPEIQNTHFVSPFILLRFCDYKEMQPYISLCS